MKNKKNVPAIRFKEFTDEWKNTDLENFVELFSGLTYSPASVRNEGTLVLRSSNVKDGRIVNADNVYVASQFVNSDHVACGDVIVVVRNGSRSLIGKHAMIDRTMNNTVIGAFMTGLRCKTPEFLNTLLYTKQFDSEVAKNLGATINQITNGAFKSMSFIISEGVEEQKAIGKYFQNIDRLIVASQEKLDKLKTIKKACLEKMFPRNDSNIPEIRFKGFTEGWSEQTLGDCADIVGGGTPSTSNKKYWDGDIDWYSPVEIGTKIFIAGSQRKITKLGLQESSAKILPVGSVLFSSRAGIGTMAILAKEGTTNQGFQSIVPHCEQLDSYFIFSRTKELKKYGETNGAGSTFIEISGKQMANMPIHNPKYDEQQAIGNYFRDIDKLITLTEQKVEKLKNIKKACLDKMFV